MLWYLYCIYQTQISKTNSRVDVVIVVVQVQIVSSVDVVLQVLRHVSQQPGGVWQALVWHPQTGGETQLRAGQVVSPGRGDRSLNIGTWTYFNQSTNTITTTIIIHQSTIITTIIVTITTITTTTTTTTNYIFITITNSPSSKDFHTVISWNAWPGRMAIAWRSQCCCRWTWERSAGWQSYFPQGSSLPHRRCRSQNWNSRRLKKHERWRKSQFSFRTWLTLNEASLQERNWRPL